MKISTVDSASDPKRQEKGESLMLSAVDATRMDERSEDLFSAAEMARTESYVRRNVAVAPERGIRHDVPSASIVTKSGKSIMSRRVPMFMTDRCNRVIDLSQISLHKDGGILTSDCTRSSSRHCPQKDIAAGLAASPCSHAQSFLFSGPSSGYKEIRDKHHNTAWRLCMEQLEVEVAEQRKLLQAVEDSEGVVRSWCMVSGTWFW
ncbi:hypothetical protein EON65_36190 [archaeon]|nr:MAG: hypothetical protein EON65_36190 [archaeon]